MSKDKKQLAQGYLKASEKRLELERREQAIGKKLFVVELTQTHVVAAENKEAAEKWLKDNIHGLLRESTPFMSMTVSDFTYPPPGWTRNSKPWNGEFPIYRWFEDDEPMKCICGAFARSKEMYDVRPELRRWSYVCKDCGMRSDWRKSKQLAVEEWNRTIADLKEKKDE